MSNNKSYSLRDYLENPWRIVNTLNKFGWIELLPDKMFIQLKWRAENGIKLELSNPLTFNEKLQWLKLYYHRPEFTTMVDKAGAKEYVTNILGDKYIIPTIGIWNTPEEIDFKSLPNQFVLKCTHDSGGIVICKDKNKLDVASANNKLNRALKRDYFLVSREWPYKNVAHKIIAEKYMADENNADLKDYKFFCFNGEPKLCQVISDRSTDEKIDFYDMNWFRIEGLCGLNINAQNSSHLIPKPKCFEEIKDCVKKLAEGIPFVRIDFYVINDNPYFGEITFFPNSGFGHFRPIEWERKLGDLIILPEPIIE